MANPPSEYPKIQSVYKRHLESNSKEFIIGEWSTPELEYLADNLWIFTEKVDGTNIRLSFDGNSLGIYGRTSRAELLPSLVESIKALIPLETLQKTFENASPEMPVFLYGEGYGEKIQNGGGYVQGGQSFILFDAMIGRKWLEFNDVTGIGISLGINVVPKVGVGPLVEAIQWCQDGFNSRLRVQPPEGLVCRPLTTLYDWRGNRIITKVKLCDWKRNENQNRKL